MNLMFAMKFKSSNSTYSIIEFLYYSDYTNLNYCFTSFRY